eukprot:5004859-Pleurochrysis_carterae.AAC.2
MMSRAKGRGRGNEKEHKSDGGEERGDGDESAVRHTARGSRQDSGENRPVSMSRGRFLSEADRERVHKRAGSAREAATTVDARAAHRRGEARG